MMNLLTTLSWFSPQDHSGEEPTQYQDRSFQRLEHCLRITSPDLPRCHALSVNISSAGLCLETFAPVKPGQAVKLSVEIGHDPITLDGTIKWCKPITKGIFRAGLCLVNSRQQSLHSFRRYIEREVNI